MKHYDKRCAVCKEAGIFHRWKALLVVIIMLLILPSVANAGIFDVALTVGSPCIPEWHCSAFSKDSCGERECVDVNACGTNAGRPEERIRCESSGGGSSDNEEPSLDIIPDFKSSIDIVRIDLLPGESSKTKIRIIELEESRKKINYTLQLSSNNALFLSIVKLSATSIEGEGSFEIIAGPSNTIGQAYSGEVEISNGEKTKRIPVIVNILSNLPQFSLVLNTSITNNQTLPLPQVLLDADVNLEDNISINYSLISSKGEEVFSIYKEGDSVSDAEVVAPMNLEKGYYFWTVTVMTARGINTKYVTIYSDPDKTLAPYVEQTQKATPATGVYLAFIAIILILGMVVIYFVRKHASSEYSDILKDVYERGFITKDEYDGFIGKKHVPEAKDDVSFSASISKEKHSGFVRAPIGKEFILSDGQILCSIKELSDKLADMDQKVFNHHVNSERNDFANWIKDVFNEEELASKIRESSTKEQIMNELNER